MLMSQPHVLRTGLSQRSPHTLLDSHPVLRRRLLADRDLADPRPPCAIRRPVGCPWEGLTSGGAADLDHRSADDADPDPLVYHSGHRQGSHWSRARCAATISSPPASLPAAIACPGHVLSSFFREASMMKLFLLASHLFDRHPAGLDMEDDYVGLARRKLDADADAARPARSGPNRSGQERGDTGLPPVTRRSLRRARVAVWCYFMVPGVTLATWTARIPAIKARLSLSDGALSLGLLAVGIGAILAMQLVGRLVDRHGSAAVMVPSAVLLALAMIAPGFAGNIGMLVLTLLVVGAGYGLLDVAMNAQAVQVERAYRRPIMASFHATYSIGGLAGAVYGSLLAHAGIAPGPTFLAIGLPMAAVVLLVSRWLLPPDSAAVTGQAHDFHGGPRLERWARPVLFLGILGMFCMLNEGAAADWSSVYLRDSLHASAGIAPLAYGVFSITMALGRLVGDRIVARIGRVALVRGGAAFAAAGLGLGLLVGTPAAGIVGFGALGAGLSCIIPQLFTTAGNWDPQRSGRIVAQVSTLSYLGLLVGPVVIGPLADVTGLPAALCVPVVLSIMVALSARAVRPTVEDHRKRIPA
jgi:MFS family permease